MLPRSKLVNLNCNLNGNLHGNPAPSIRGTGVRRASVACMPMSTSRSTYMYMYMSGRWRLVDTAAERENRPATGDVATPLVRHEISLQSSGSGFGLRLHCTNWEGPEQRW
jgi:hypothetical protein